MSAENNNPSSTTVHLSKKFDLPPSFYSTSAFNNKSVFYRIIEHLKLNDVLNCRLVNRKWNHMTTNYLRSSDPSSKHQIKKTIEPKNRNSDSYVCKLKLTAPFDDGEHYEDDDGTRYKPLSEFIECIKNTKLGYWTKITIQLTALANDQGVEEVLNFFSYCGSSITSLKLTFVGLHYQNSNVDTIGTQLMGIFPFVQTSIQKLTISYVGCCDFPISNLPVPDIVLPDLKILKANINLVDQKFFETILEAAINLQEFRLEFGGFPLTQKYCQVFMDQNKLKTIKMGEVDLADEGNFKFLKKLFRSRHSDLKLTVLSFNYCYWRNFGGSTASLSSPKTASVVSAVLENQKKNIRILNFQFLFQNLAYLKLPVFHHLKILYLRTEAKQFDEKEVLQPIFQKDFDFSSNFPNVDQLFIYVLSTGFSKGWESSTRTLGQVLVGQDQQFKSIKILHVSGYKAAFWIVKQALTVFPSVISIHWSVGESLQKFFQRVFTLPNMVRERIKSLKMTDLFLGQDDAFPAFDSIFTGFSQETCKSLFSLPPKFLKSLSAAQIDGLRVNPSILNLPNLETLYLHFDVRFWGDDEQNVSAEDQDDDSSERFITFMNNLITSLSKEYTFTRMKNLRFKADLSLSKWKHLCLACDLLGFDDMDFHK